METAQRPNKSELRTMPCLVAADKLSGYVKFQANDTGQESLLSLIGFLSHGQRCHKDPHPATMQGTLPR